MKWIPVTERLPDVLNKKYVCRCYNEGTKKIVLKTVFLSQDKVFESRLKVIEWLNESASLPSSSVTGEEEKDLIIQGLEEGSELWKAEYDNCRAILTELVYLKNLKDSAGKTEEYEQRQPLVWITAKMFLEQYQHQ